MVVVAPVGIVVGVAVVGTVGVTLGPVVATAAEAAAGLAPGALRSEELAAAGSARCWAIPRVANSAKTSTTTTPMTRSVHPMSDITPVLSLGDPVRARQGKHGQ